MAIESENTMKYMFIDAETDGLYGSMLSVASIICDEKGQQVDSFYGFLDCSINDIKDDWVKKNVYPYLKQRDNNSFAYKSEQEMLSDFWSFYRNSGECYCIGDVIYPVEAQLMRKCVEMDLKERKFQGPFPFLDLSSMLYAKGIDPSVERRQLVDCSKYQLHNALDDVRMSIDIWRQYIL